MGGSGRAGGTWVRLSPGVEGPLEQLEASPFCSHPKSCLDSREEGTRNLKNRKYPINIVEMVSSIALME